MRGNRGTWTVSAPRLRPSCTVLSSTPVPAGVPNSPGGKLKDPVIRREREMAILPQRVEFDWRV